MNRNTKAFISNANHLSAKFRHMCRNTCWSRSIGSEAGLTVKITSHSFIKPSSPTPPHLRNFKLSLLDQLFPNTTPHYYTLLLFYPPTKPAAINANDIPSLLRDSLSQTLSHLYPLAGTIKRGGVEEDISTIQCTDKGVEYFEAVADQEILHFLTTVPPNAHLLRRLAPPQPQTSAHMPVACVQTTRFRCGGVAVAVSLEHIIADASCSGMLFNHWAAVARGDRHVVETMYAHNDAASLFPINQAVLTSRPQTMQNDGPIEAATAESVLQRFVFEPEQLSALKSRVRCSEVPNPSRTLAIFALLWETAMKAYKRSFLPGEMTPSPSPPLRTPVNLRPKLMRALPPGYTVGNLLWHTKMRYDQTDGDQLKRLTCQLKRSMDQVDAEFAENLVGEKGHATIRGWLEAREEGKEYIFSSCVKLGLNRVDFGWGEPVWLTFLRPTGGDAPDFVILLQPRDGVVEALVWLTAKELAIFERDPQLLRYAKVNPTVISPSSYSYPCMDDFQSITAL